MNQSDEEEVKEITDIRREEIENLLEPQMIPDERIIRHAERNDSYRELPTLDKSEEIVQPPLDPSSEDLEIEAESLLKNNDVDNLEVFNNVSSVDQGEIMPPTISYLSQIDIEPLKFNEQKISEVQQESQLIVSDSVDVQQQLGELPQFERETQNQVQPQPKIESNQSATLYHTVSGGPETIHDVKLAEQKANQTTSSPVVASDYSMSSTTGYTIPSPDYVAPPLPQQSKSNIGLIFLLLVIFSVTYLYFFVPETFTQAYEVFLFVKDWVSNLLGK